MNKREEYFFWVCMVILRTADGKKKSLFLIFMFKKPWALKKNDLSFVTWCIILLEVSIRRWVHCSKSDKWVRSKVILKVIKSTLIILHKMCQM